MTTENIMGLIGKLVFVLLCVKYRNNPDEYLAIIKIDRLSLNYGFDSISYTDAIKTKEQEQGFLNNFEDTLPSQYLNEILTQHSFSNVKEDKQ